MTKASSERRVDRPVGSAETGRTRYGWGTLLAVGLMLVASLQGIARAQSTPQIDLVFLLDGSGSISNADWQLQKDGYAAAVQDTTAFPTDGTVAVAVVQWSSTTRVEIPLTILDSQQKVATLVDEIQGIQQLGQSTNPGDGVRRGADLLVAEGRSGADWVECMSTDGTTNSGESLGGAVDYARNTGVDRYSVVGIEDFPGDGANLGAHYRPHVFGGGAVTIARNAAEFSSLIIGACINDPIELRALEVNQTIQDWENSVDLVAGKRTVVRAFARVKPGEDPQRIAGRLIAERDGAELPESPLAAQNPGASILIEENAISQRADLRASLNFRLPPSWLSGTVTMHFEGGGTAVECQDAAAPFEADCSVTVTFSDMPRPEVRYIGFPHGSTRAPNVDELLEQDFRAEGLLPVPRLQVDWGSMDAGFEDPTDPTDVLGGLQRRRFWDLCFSLFGCDAIYYGVLLGQHPEGQVGAAFVGGTAGASYTWGLNGRNDEGEQRNTVGHELAHVFGLPHAVGADDCTGDGAEPYPHTGTITGPTGDSSFAPLLGPLGDSDREVWGVDTRFVRHNASGLAVIDPHETAALMSYCWVGSPQDTYTAHHEWDMLMESIGTRFESSATASADAGAHLVVSGAIDLGATAPSVTLDPVGIVGDEVPQPDPGNYSVRLRGADGSVITEVPFQPEVAEVRVAQGVPDPPPVGLFTVPVPKPASPYAAVEILSGSTVIASKEASAHPPQVETLVPAAGSSQSTDNVRFSWTASDADGDPLTYTVRYSADGGATWETLAIDLQSTELSVSRDLLAGSASSVFQVIASDGVLASSATSQAFTVQDSGPIVSITSPLDREQFYSGVQMIMLEATALDAQDATVEEMTWTSDRDGIVATGALAAVRADTLSEGAHVITVAATDSGGRMGIARVSIEVFRVAPPPPPEGNPPDCSMLTTSAPELWPPNGKMRLVTVTGATDPDPNDSVTLVVHSITQDEPTGGGDDADLTGLRSDQAWIRAEREGSGDGRVYRLAITATDSAGLSCEGTAAVAVPHDRGAHGTAVDSAPPSYDSLSS